MTKTELIMLANQFYPDDSIASQWDPDTETITDGGDLIAKFIAREAAFIAGDVSDEREQLSRLESILELVASEVERVRAGLDTLMELTEEGSRSVAVANAELMVLTPESENNDKN